MQSIRKLIAFTAKPPAIYLLLMALIVLNILMNAPGLPSSTPAMQAIAPSFTPFDLQYRGYDLIRFKNDLDSLGEKGRSICRNFMYCDILFPAVYALFFSSIIFLVFGQRKHWIKWLFLVPLLTGLMDYVENIFLAIAVSAFPTSPSWAVSIASMATQIKMICNGMMIVALLLTIGGWLINSFHKRG